MPLMFDITFSKAFNIKVKTKYIARPVRPKRGRVGYFSLPRKERLPLRMTHTKKEVIACIEQSDQCGEDQYARQIEIRYLNKKLGRGVFAKKTIEPGVVGIYAGELKKMGRYPKSRYLFSFTARKLKDVIIDGEKKGNWTIFMNHNPSRSKATNIRVEEYFYKGLPYIVFYAPKRIKKGRQLLYDYGESYWQSLEIKPQVF
jgi:hypothetical protein